MRLEKNSKVYPKANMDLIFEGEFSSTGNEYVYMCYKFSLFFLIDIDDKTLKLGRTIDGFDLPRAKDKDIGGGYILNGIEPDNFINYAFTTSKNEILILSNVIRQSNSGKRVLDIYDSHSLEYSRSILLPNYENQRPVDIAYSDNNLSILYENYSITSYEF